MAETATTTETTAGAGGATGEQTQSGSTASQTLETIMTGGTTAQPKTKPAAGEKAKGSETAGTGTAPAWTSQLPDEIKGNPETLKQFAQFQKIGDLAKSWTELQSKSGNSVTIPGKDAKPEEVASFYEKLGRPAKADGYKIEGDADGKFAALAYQNNLSVEQAKSMFHQIAEIGKASVEQKAQAAHQKMLETNSALEKEYGAKLPEKLTLLSRGLAEFGGQELKNELTQAGLIYSPNVVKLFIKLGEMTAEAGTTSRGTAGGNKKYVSTSDGGAFEFKLRGEK